jgi:outer membrane protein assembly factor BamB
LCLDLRNGKTLWNQPAPGGVGATHQKNTLASCTGATDGERVFMPFWDGKDLSLAAYTIDGKALWNVPLGPYASQHGAGMSPIVVGNRVILVNDQDGSAEVLAFDVANGEIVWRKARPPFKACYSTPLLLEQPGTGPEIVVASTAGVSGYEPATGAEKWKWNWTSNNLHLRTVGSPILSQEMVIFSGGNGPGDRHAVAVKLQDRHKDMNGDHLAWETRKVLPYVPCMLAEGEHIYFVNDAGIAGCVVARSGETVWNQRLGIGKVTASPLMVEGRIYAFGEEGGISIFDAHPRNKQFSTSKLNEGVFASPAVADGKLLVRGRENLYCFGTN